MDTSPVTQFTLTCKNCGAQMEQKNSSVVKCSYCGTQVTLVSNSNQKNFKPAAQQQPLIKRINKPDSTPVRTTAAVPDIQFDAVCKECGGEMKRISASEIKCNYCGFEINLTPNLQDQTKTQLALNNAAAVNSTYQQPFPQFSTTFKFWKNLQINLTFGLLIWFIYYVIRAFLRKTNYALPSEYFNNLFVSPIFKYYWALRGVTICLITATWGYFLDFKNYLFDIANFYKNKKSQ